MFITQKNLNFRTAAHNTQDEAQGEASTDYTGNKGVGGSMVHNINNLLALIGRGGVKWFVITLPERSHLWVEHSMSL